MAEAVLIGYFLEARRMKFWLIARCLSWLFASIILATLSRGMFKCLAAWRRLSPFGAARRTAPAVELPHPPARVTEAKYVAGFYAPEAGSPRDPPVSLRLSSLRSLRYCHIHNRRFR